ncbi:flagellar hook-associated protein FlgK [Acetobacterium fimetarium]|uniref:Flagellar hook-associated protein 1 n=1 Tax=Acetobacterium fimetarium TaxID=52691 RepID=A0ABR6WWK5_9FIRM|nr:flagellar hook-associated protein FlgK [Acetobacterium fimetarium]MBC3805014.1 flagellar hook-associated protein FlgK [Acetobacterium fimetarium]
MRGSFEAFQVASRGMAASQATINVTGNNVANVNTEGYTRQRVDVNSVTISGAVQKYANPQISSGLGAEAVGTSQSRDPYVDTRFRAQNAETSTYNTMKSSLTNLEDVFDEAENEALQGQLSDFTNTLQSLSNATSSSDISQVVRSAAQKVTQYINMYANQLEDVRAEQTEDLNIVTDNFNVYVKNIANLNDQIQKEEIYGNTPNELYDQRNLLIDKLSAVANIKVTTKAQKVEGSENLTISHLSITLNDVTDSDDNPITIVDNDDFASLTMVEVTTKVDGKDVKTGEVSLTLEDAKGVINKNAEKAISNGSIKGYLDIINGKGSFADISKGESDAKGISYYSKSMDIFAQTFAKTINDINALYTHTDTATGTITHGTALFTSTDGTSTTDITAANIRVSTAWLDDPTNIKTTSTDAETTTGKPDNVLRMISEMNSTEHDYKKPDGTDYGSKRSFHEYVTGLLGELSTDVGLYTNFSKTANGVLDTISTMRDETSGVSLNEEGVNLTAFQKVYNATIRYFNVLDENLDKVINSMGV